MNPAELIPPTLPDGLSPAQALLTVVLALAQDGAALEPGGLLPRRALKEGPVEQNQARELALAAFPLEARLRKVGMEIHRKRLTLTFDFPATAQKHYADMMEQLIEQTGWDVQVNPATNQQALGFAVDELLPPGGAHYQRAVVLYGSEARWRWRSRASTIWRRWPKPIWT